MLMAAFAEALPPAAGAVEVREPVDRSRLGDRLVVFSCQERGPSRRRMLIEAAKLCDLVTLELADCDARVLRGIPASQRLVTLRRGAATAEELTRELERMRHVPARFYRIEVEARRSGEELAPLQLLRDCGRDDVIAYALGEIGFWTRVLAAWLGAPLIAGDVARYASDYGLPHLREVDRIFGIVGSPVLQSLSPRFHNAGFASLGDRSLYLPFHVDEFQPFWEHVVESRAIESLGFSIGAFCVVSPHKETALAAATSKTPMVARARSTNFFVKDGDRWTAATTDPDGVLDTLSARGIDPAGHGRIAVIGCGGSGRAVAAALQQAGADVTLVNRGFDRGSFAVRLLRLPFLPLAGFSADAYSVVINATPVGRDGAGSPFDVDSLRPDAVVIDFAYNDGQTPLARSARRRGQTTIDGRDVLMAQARSQFRLMTGQDMPHELAHQIVHVSS
ncbi:MAG TPA: type I 3-dehydroquinate dehydratase [Thermoanaerobaculia bacterium]|jgi:3-dehydroquinate dehydratase/shikimate dehydrogenase|nr:type I 3-dehydroquinate dehydratase [Thermoanaerobaculia bacterium]